MVEAEWEQPPFSSRPARAEGRASRDHHRHSRLAAAALSVAIVLGCIVAATGLGIGTERSLQSVRDAVHEHSASGRLALIEIDAKSLEHLDHWPWPRSLYVQAIHRLEAAGATAIAFDVDFSSRSVAVQDRNFAKGIAEAKVPIILSTFRQPGTSKGGDLVESQPLSMFRHNAQLAGVNISADTDALIRRYPFGTVTGGISRPSIGAILSGGAGRIDEEFAIDGAIDPASIPRWSFLDLIEGRVPPDKLHGRAVLIGATAIELGDRYAVPRHGVIPGPVIQLLAAETLAAGSSPVDRGPAVPLLAAIIGVFVAAQQRGRARKSVALGVALGLVTLLPLATELAHWGSFEIVPAIAALSAGFAVLAIGSMAATLRAARLTDPASGLLNRQGFSAHADDGDVKTVVALRIANYSEAAGVVGQEHAAEMIKRVVDRLRTAGIEEVFRLQDDVLAWTCALAASEAVVGQIEGIFAVLRSPVEAGGRQIELRCRFGLSCEPAASIDILADRALLAADHAVETGLRLVVHDDALGQSQDWRLLLAGELDHALVGGDIWVAYQPKLNLRSGRIDEAEALVRWTHPQRGAIPPDAFIPALEESGRILDLTLFVLRRALKDARMWVAAGTPIRVAVNVSALLTIDTEFLAALETVIASDPLAPQLLTLEVTESAALSDPARAIATLERVAKHGIKLSIDDYGTGQSTLTYLKQLPAREIKIDKSFILGLAHDTSDQAMVRSTIALAHELGYTVVAEGIETQATLDLLCAMGCDNGQGWHIGKPVTAAAFETAFVAQKAAA